MGIEQCCRDERAGIIEGIDKILQENATALNGNPCCISNTLRRSDRHMEGVSKRLGVIFHCLPQMLPFLEKIRASCHSCDGKSSGAQKNWTSWTCETSSGKHSAYSVCELSKCVLQLMG